MRHLFMALLFILIGMIVSCGGDDNGVEPDTTPPTVVLTTPADGAVDIPIGSVITARFSENMNPATITTSTFTIDNGVTGTVSYTERVATFTPDNELAYDSTYTVTISTGVRDASGNAMSQAFSWSFETFSINTPPTVISTNPVSGGTDVAVTARVSATFSKAMNPATIDETTFTINHGVTGTVSYDNKIAVFTPDEYLAYDTLYTATITTGVEDTLGNAMEEDYTWQFTAEPVSMTDAEEFFPMANGDTWYFYSTVDSRQVTRMVMGDTVINSVPCKKVLEDGVVTEAWALSAEGFEIHLIEEIYRLEPPLTIPLNMVLDETFSDTAQAYWYVGDTLFQAEFAETIKFKGYTVYDVPAGNFEDVIHLLYLEGAYNEYYARGVGLLDNDDYVLDSAYVGGIWYR